MTKTVASKYIFFSIVAVYMALGMVRSIGIYRFISMEFTITLMVSGGLICLFWFGKKTIRWSQIVPLILLALLTPYSLLFSRDPSLSIIMAFFPFISGLLYLALSETPTDKHTIIEGINPKQDALEAAKYAFIVWAAIHALTQVIFYLFMPIRTTGLMDDYSQASMLILCAYSMAYPMLKHKPYFLAFSLLFFVAFFASFSRTANFLLIIFLFAVLVSALKTRSYSYFLKVSASCAIALLFVYTYPSLVGEASVDRGGLNHLSTLNSRTIYWQAAWEAIQQRPLLGHGIGTYSYTGINEAQPFNTILYVHNDYLQIWHDLGVLWLAAFIIGFGTLLLRNVPARRPDSVWHLSAWRIDIGKESRFFAWVTLVCIAAYMSINFLITNIEFQVAIAIFAAQLSGRVSK